MAPRTFFRIAGPAALACSSLTLQAQSPAEPTAYTVTVQYEVTGTAIQTIHRLGRKVLVDRVPSLGVPSSADRAPPTRVLYFLDTGQSLSWEPSNAAGGCRHGIFHGDEWLDPFSGAADFALPGVTQLGSETIHGIASKILVSKAKPGMKLWVDPKTGLMLKATFTAPSTGKAITYFEVTDVHLEPPPSGLFEVPAQCLSDSDASKGTHSSN